MTAEALPPTLAANPRLSTWLRIRSDGMVSLTSAARMPMSEGRTRPMMAAIPITHVGESSPVKARIISEIAHAA